MSKKDFINGTILEFKVPTDIGYAYCKILDFRHIRQFDGVLVKVFNHIVKKPVSDISVLSSKDLLFGARRMMGLPNTRGRGAWKSKGVLISGDDNIIPDFKYSDKPTAFLVAGPWKVMQNIRNSVSAPYENVKHLEDTIVSPMPAIEIRTAMEYYRINNINVADHFDLTMTINDLIYKQMMNVPIFSTIPKEKRGKGNVGVE